MTWTSTSLRRWLLSLFQTCSQPHVMGHSKSFSQVELFLQPKNKTTGSQALSIGDVNFFWQAGSEQLEQHENYVTPVALAMDDDGLCENNRLEERHPSGNRGTSHLGETLEVERWTLNVDTNVRRLLVREMERLTVTGIRSENQKLDRKCDAPTHFELANQLCRL
jgi:hypothetical protein